MNFTGGGWKMSNVIPFPIERWQQHNNRDNITALWFAPLHYWCMTMSIMTTKSEAGVRREHFGLDLSTQPTSRPVPAQS
jgi:hypothetical protein